MFILLFIVIGLNSFGLEMGIKSVYSDDILQAFKKSIESENEEDYELAISVLKDVYKEDSYEINLRLGWLTYVAESYEESMTYYKKCFTLKPMSIEARLGYVYPASTLGYWDETLVQYKKILELDPQNSYVNYQTGTIYYNRQDYEQAQKHYEKVVNLYPFDSSSLLMLGWTKYMLGKSAEARVLFSKVLLLDASNESATEGLELIK